MGKWLNCWIASKLKRIKDCIIAFSNNACGAERLCSSSFFPCASSFFSRARNSRVCAEATFGRDCKSSEKERKRKGFFLLSALTPFYLFFSFFCRCFGHFFCFQCRNANPTLPNVVASFFSKTIKSGSPPRR